VLDTENWTPIQRVDPHVSGLSWQKKYSSLQTTLFFTIETFEQKKGWACCTVVAGRIDTATSGSLALSIRHKSHPIALHCPDVFTWRKKIHCLFDVILHCSGARSS
jgi:hypothetical protein